MQKAFNILYSLFFTAFSLLAGCKKFIAINAPSTLITEENVYRTDATAAAVLTGIYTNMSKTNLLSNTSYFPSLSGDELSLFNATDPIVLATHKNGLTEAVTPDLWTTAFYPVVYQANSAINKLQSSTALTSTVKSQLLGEAYFVRALCYFYLTQFYGNVPILLTTDYQVNNRLDKSAQPQVYQQIIADLQLARSLLRSDYLDASLIKTTTERVRPTQGAAIALLARVYLYTKDYSNAEKEAGTILDNKAKYDCDTVAVADVFKKNSKETIWALQPVLGTTSQNTQDGRYFILPTTGPTSVNPIYLSSLFLTQFEIGDKRRSNWVASVISNGVTYNYVNKYKVGLVNTQTVEYVMVLRLAELYLIRAEARAQLQKSNGIDDLNVIRKRAGVQLLSFTTYPDLLLAIEHERQIELFTEQGHRWFDLRRTGKINSVMPGVTAQKGGTWESKSALYPIPSIEMQRNPVFDQTPGY